MRGQDPNLGGALVLCGVLVVAAIGMWRMRYWAVLGFEVLLGVLMVSAALSLLVASNLRGALLAVVVIALTGPLFWALIRTMARLQMPAAPAPRDARSACPLVSRALCLRVPTTAS